MRPTWIAVGAGVLISMLAALPGRAAAAADDAGRCAVLRGLAGPDARVDAVEAVPAGGQLSAPAHCRLQFTLRPRRGVGGQAFGVGVELRLPARWNGRFLFQGGGGLDGVIRPALGPSRSGGPSALEQGFAVASTDAGHQGLDAGFASDQQARLDYAYVAIGEVAARAKQIVTDFYGSAPAFAYFDGCSNGGRQAMMAAQRYPLLFDGVVAGDPGFRLSRAAVAEAWDTLQFSRVAPRDAAGRPILAAALTPADLELVAARVNAQCDRLDGLADGAVNNWRACRFDPAVLTCRGKAATGCLPAAKVRALRQVFDGARDSRGRALYAAWPFDPGLAGRDWRAWKLGDAPTARSNSLNATLGMDALGRYFSTPPLPGPADPLAFDFDAAEARVAEVGAINDAVSPFLTSFRQHGGKLLIYHGLADPVFSAADTAAWFDRVQAVMGPTDDWARLFLVPGMNHCSGGPATDSFDALAAVQAWVERGVAPDRLIAGGRLASGAPPVERPLCPYPAYAHYVGGPAGASQSFQCRTGGRSDGPAGQRRPG